MQVLKTNLNFLTKSRPNYFTKPWLQHGTRFRKQWVTTVSSQALSWDTPVRATRRALQRQVLVLSRKSLCTAYTQTTLVPASRMNPAKAGRSHGLSLQRNQKYQIWFCSSQPPTITTSFGKAAVMSNEYNYIFLKKIFVKCNYFKRYLYTTSIRSFLAFHSSFTLIYGNTF